ncbi:MAG: hypothetical protein WC375_05430 [Methanomassiliicoccales archaeon]|jgi:hypothetical protein
MKKLNIVIICSDSKKDQMMHAFDVFEPFKRLGEVHHMTGDLNDGVTQSQALENIRNAFEKDGTYRILAIFIPNDPEGAFIDTTVKVISNGSQWGLFKNLLASLQYAGDMCAIA